jgi:hypothetical protein
MASLQPCFICKRVWAKAARQARNARMEEDPARLLALFDLFALEIPRFLRKITVLIVTKHSPTVGPLLSVSQCLFTNQCLFTKNSTIQFQNQFSQPKQCRFLPKKKRLCSQMPFMPINQVNLRVLDLQPPILVCQSRSFGAGMTVGQMEKGVKPPTKH